MSVIVEVIVPDPVGDDVAYGAGEYVRLRNTGTENVDLSGWQVVDAVGHVLSLPVGTRIAAAGILRLHPGPGNSDPERIFFGRRAAVINNMVEHLQLKNATGEVVSALGSGTADGYTFNHEVAWPTELKLIYAGTSATGFGLPTSAAAIRLSVPGGPQHELSGKLDGTSVILASLPTSMVPGWYDTHLTVRDVTGEERSATRLRLPFGPVDRATIVIDLPRNPPEWSFGESLRLKIKEPVGTRLGELGLADPGQLNPTLTRTDGGAAITGFGGSKIGEDTITLSLPLEPYVGYRPGHAQHFVNPGIPEEIFKVDTSKLKFNLVPLPLQVEDVEALVKRMFDIGVPSPEVTPGQTPQWAVEARSADSITVPGMPDSTLSLVKDLVYKKGTILRMTCRLTVEGTPAGQTWTSSPTTTESPEMAPGGASFGPVFGMLRPTIRRHTGGAPRAADGFKARLAVKAILTGLPKPLPDRVEVDVDVPSDKFITQLPLLVPSLAVFADARYKPAFERPGNRLLVLLDGMPALVGDRVLSTKVQPESVEKICDTLGLALMLLRGVIPKLGETFPGFPGASSLPGPDSDELTELDLLNEWLTTPGVEITIAGFAAHPDIGAREFSNHPAWWDAPSAAFLVGLQGGGLSGRMLRAYSEPNGHPGNSAYLDMRVPAGQVTACLWTLHESVFRDGYFARAPFTVITEPDPLWQWRDAEDRADRHNMPWFFGVGASFGNVINAYEWTE